MKSFFSFVLYSLTALTACFFALILVLNFLNPAFSNTSDDKKESITFKKVFSDIFSNLKQIFKDNLNPDKENQEEEKEEDYVSSDTNQEGQDSPPDSFEGNLEGVVVPNNQELAPQGAEVPAQGGELAPQGAEVPAQGGELAPQGAGVPAQGGELAPQGAEVPAQGGGLAPQGAGVPAQGGELAPQGSGVSAQGGGLAPQGAEVPAQGGGLVPQGAEVVPAQGGELAPQGASSEISLEIQAQMAPFIYEVSTERSPFDDPTRIKTSGQVIGEDGEVKVVIPKTPPEMYNLQDINLKGIIWNIKNPKALFELPDGEGHYTLIKGDKIGKNGLIFEIREDEVVIVETFYKGDNEQEAESVIKIKKMNRLKLDEGVKS